MYKKAQASFWVAEEIDLTTDMADWALWTNNKRHPLCRVLAFFASSDGIVNKNLVMNFATEIQIPEARCFYGFQIMIENVHAETYSQLIDTYIADPAEKASLFNALDQIPSVKAKGDWALRWTTGESSFAERLIAFAVVKGLFFSGLFAAIFWFRKRGLLPGLAHANELISRDEGMHTTFAVTLYQYLEKKPASLTILRIILEAVEVEKDFMQGTHP